MALTKISTGGVKDDAITSGKIPNNAIGNAELTDACVGSVEITNSCVDTNHLVSGAVETSKINNDAVTSAKIADDAVTSAKIADASVDEARLQISNTPTNGQFLSAQSGNTGGLTWSDVTIPPSGNTVDLVADGAIAAGKPVIVTTAGKIKSVGTENQNITNPSMKSNSNIPSNLQGYEIVGIWHETSGKGLMMYKKGTQNNSASGKYRQFRLDAAGSITNIDTEGGFAGSYPEKTKLIMDPDIDKPIMVWQQSDGYIYTRSVTIDGNGANHSQASTQGNSSGIAGAPANGWDMCYATNADVFVAVHRDASDSGKGKIRLGYQTEPATGQHKIVWISTNIVEFSTDCETPRCVFDTVNNKVIITWGQAGGDVSACIGTISNSGSSATISVGTAVVVNSVGTGNGRPKLAWNTTDGVAGLLYRRADNNQNALITIKTSGTTVHYNSLVRIGTEDADEMAIWYNSPLGTFSWSVKGRIGWISSTGTATAGGSSSVAATEGSGAVDLSQAFGGNVGNFEPSAGFDLPDHPLVTGHTTSNHGGDGGRLKLITLTIAGAISNLTSSNTVGFAPSAISDTATGTINCNGNTVDNQSGLTAGTRYYIQGNGTLGTSVNGTHFGGLALSSSKILISQSGH